MKQIRKRRGGKTLSFPFIIILKGNILSFSPVLFKNRTISSSYFLAHWDSGWFVVYDFGITLLKMLIITKKVAYLR